jgi:hypothetical protein
MAAMEGRQQLADEIALRKTQPVAAEPAAEPTEAVEAVEAE